MSDAVGRLGQLRQRVLDRFGRRGVHAIEDGLAVGVILGLWVTYQPAAVALLLALGAAPKRAGLVAVLREIPDLVRVEDARAQEAYLVGAAVIGSAGGLLLGAGFRAAAAWAGVDVPPIAELLALVA